jgi:hypothetical protein
VLRTLVASATTTALLAAGCTPDRPWPAHPVAISAQAFATRGDIVTIDVLPLDLQLWAEPGYEVNLATLRSGSEVNIMNTALDTLAKRNYTVGAMIDWNGDFPGGNALSRDELLATVGSLSRYGAAATEHPGQLPVPFLPVRLGTATGADATLYVGGWGYVAMPHGSAGEQVAEGLLIGLLIVSVVAIIALVASSSKSSSHGHGHGGGGHASGAASSGGHASGAAGSGGHASGAASSGGHASGAAGGHAARGAFTASRGVDHVHHVGRAVAGIADAFGRAAVDIALSSPDWGEDPELPHEGGESQMYLEMTLVDNHTGLALWHAHQSFPASAANARDTARVARTMLAQLPDRTSQPQTAAK